jgi:erythronate-4-phosphate dehydrogenase
MKLIADNTIPFLKGIAEDFAEITYLSSTDFSPSAVKDADALIIRSIDKCTSELLKDSRVKLITTATIGFDHIDTKYCETAGIVWRNAPGCNATSVAEYLVACLLSVALKRGEELAGKTIGIIGMGHVGIEVERCCTALGMHVMRNDPLREEIEGTADFVSLEEMAHEADIITIHTPLEKTGKYPTYHLANRAFFEKLERCPWFINAARGSIHDTNALIEAKEKGLISELILDCWEHEPSINRRLLDLASIATPHIAGFSADGKANATRACLENIGRFFQIPRIRIDDIHPLPPKYPQIDLSGIKENLVARAVFHCFNPMLIDKTFRAEPERFEQFRAEYPHPREFFAYTVINAPEKEAEILRKLGFNIKTKKAETI